MSDSSDLRGVTDAISHIMRRLDTLEAQVAYLSQAQGNSVQAGFDAQPAPIGARLSGQPTPAAPAAGGMEQQIILLAQSGNKIQAIKLYRELTNCDLRTAKAFVDQF